MYAAQIYRSVLPFLFVPVFLSALGAESYSVIAFYLTLVALLGLLDVGFSSAIVKMFSGSAADESKRLQAYQLFFRFLRFVSVLSILIFAIIYLCRDLLAYEWLKQNRQQPYFAQAVTLIGLTIAVTYLKQFLLCFFTAIERHALVALFNVLGPTMGFAGGYWLLTTATHLPDYFLWLAVVGLAEIGLLLALLWQVYRKEPAVQKGVPCERAQWSLILRPTLALGGLSMLWVSVTQADKVLASYYMQPEQFSYYQIGAQLAGVVAILATPLIQYLMPRLNRLQAAGQHQEFTSTFFRAASWFLFFSWSVVMAVFVNGELLLQLWLSGPAAVAGVAQQAGYLFMAALFSAAMQFVFLLVFAFNLIHLHIKAYFVYACIAVLGTFIVAQARPEWLGLWFLLHAVMLFMVWGGMLIRRFYQHTTSFFAVNFCLLPLCLLFTETLLKYWLGSSPPLLYIAARIVVFMGFAVAFYWFAQRIFSRVSFR